MTLPKANFRHVGVGAFDPDELAKFYTRWFAMVVSDTGSGIADNARVVFMTGDPQEHHQIAFVYDSLEDLKELALQFAKAGVPILQQKDHGNTWSIYIEDPEGNRVECYTPSPWYVKQPTWMPLDLLTESVELIRSRTEAAAKARPECQTREAWMAGIQARIDAARNAV